jgi:hypothetical protein
MAVAGTDVWKGRWIVVTLDDGHFDGAFVAATFIVGRLLSRCPWDQAPRSAP